MDYSGCYQGLMNRSKLSYLERVSKAVGLGIIDQGVVAQAQILHDDWCKRKPETGKGCNCNPDIVISCSDGTRATIDDDGQIVKLM